MHGPPAPLVCGCSLQTSMPRPAHGQTDLRFDLALCTLTTRASLKTPYDIYSQSQARSLSVTSPSVTKVSSCCCSRCNCCSSARTRSRCRSDEAQRLCSPPPACRCSCCSAPRPPFSVGAWWQSSCPTQSQLLPTVYGTQQSVSSRTRLSVTTFSSSVDILIKLSTLDLFVIIMILKYRILPMIILYGLPRRGHHAVVF
jgi:hypothetical protein